MAKQQIERADGSVVMASYVRHVRTLTGNMGSGDDDVDLFRLADGSTVECISPASDCRVTPREVEASAPSYPGHRAGQ